MMKYSIVVAVAENGIIGADGDMPWKLSTDLKRFKQLTLGKVVIMGRKTFEAIGNKPLVDRTNIVITRDKNWNAPDTLVAHSLDDAMALGSSHSKELGTTEICIVGGGEIYRQAMDIADTLYITWVCASPDGDTSFPSVDDSIWECTHEQTIPAGPADDVETRYCVYVRRS